MINAENHQTGMTKKPPDKNEKINTYRQQDPKEQRFAPNGGGGIVTRNRSKSVLNKDAVNNMEEICEIIEPEGQTRHIEIQTGKFEEIVEETNIIQQITEKNLRRKEETRESGYSRNCEHSRAYRRPNFSEQ